MIWEELTTFMSLLFHIHDTHISRWVARILKVFTTSHIARTRVGCVLKLHHRPGTILALTQKNPLFGVLDMKIFFVAKNAHGAENSCLNTLNLVQIVFSRKKKNFDKNLKISTFLPFLTSWHHTAKISLFLVPDMKIVFLLENAYSAENTC